MNLLNLSFSIFLNMNMLFYFHNDLRTNFSIPICEQGVKGPKQQGGRNKGSNERRKYSESLFSYVNPKLNLYMPKSSHVSKHVCVYVYIHTEHIHKHAISGMWKTEQANKSRKNKKANGIYMNKE